MTEVVRRSRRRRLRAFVRLHQRRAALRRAQRRKVLGPVACVFIAILAAIGAAYEPERSVPAGLAIDATVALRTVVAPWDGLDSRAEVVVIGLDDRTLNDPEYSEWPRILMSPLWAAATDKAMENGARGAVFDVVFSFAAPTGREGLRDAMAEFDEPLALTFWKHRRSLVIARTKDYVPAPRFAGVLLAAGNDTIALAELERDGDEVMRRAPTAFETTDGGRISTLSAAALSRMTDHAPPADAINLTPPFRLYDLPSVAMVDVLKCEDEASLTALFENRIVVLGGTIGLEDQIRSADRFLPQDPPPAHPPAGACDLTPVSAGQPGVFAHAAAIDGALRGWAPTKVEEAGGGVAVAATFVIALVAALAAFFIGALPGVAISVAGLPFLFLTIAAVALDRGVLLAFAAPIIAAPVAYTASIGVRAWVFDGARRLMQRQFSHYLSTEVIDDMVRHETLPKLGGEIRTVTIMFVDLSGFTNFAEDKSNSAAHVMQVLNRHLTVIAGAVHDYGGYVDKFIGDAVMAIWNAPREAESHAALALGAALQIRREIAAMARPDRPAMRVKIGIESGDANVGNVGAPDRLSYTAIGDIVNLSARLEAANSRFLAGVLVGPNAAEGAVEANGPPLLRIATITVKGRENTPTEIHTPVGADDPAVIEIHERATTAFEAGDFIGAATIWREAPRDAAPWAKAMAEEADTLAEAPPETWKGVINLTTK